MTFIEVTVWGRTAEIVGEYLSKGRQVLFEGRLQQDTWQDKETGKNRSKLKVVAEQMTMLGSRGEATGEGNQDPQPQWSEGSQDGGEVPF